VNLPPFWGSLQRTEKTGKTETEDDEDDEDDENRPLSGPPSE